MPETTENYHRIPVSTGHSGHKIRTLEVSASRGIKALYCVDCGEIITYLFDVDRWTMEEARRWVEEHSGKGGRMGKVTKVFQVEVKEASPDGGEIIVSTGGLDRDNDRVLATGARLDHYMKNPVVQWAHNYRDPWATIGRTREMAIEKEGPGRIRVRFDLRPPASEADPQHIIRLLWSGGWVNAASIGFNPLSAGPGGKEEGPPWVENELGGRDFPDWEFLEWSLLPIPANQDALRLAAKALAPHGIGEFASRYFAEPMRIFNPMEPAGASWFYWDTEKGLLVPMINISEEEAKARGLEPLENMGAWAWKDSTKEVWHTVPKVGGGDGGDGSTAEADATGEEDGTDDMAAGANDETDKMSPAALEALAEAVEALRNTLRGE